ncbi:MAG: hypothetical protein P1V20_08955 [Verrucomicrobiales bacterium]|nr:hypothetical protein [Verrucomicrobiales bacterium]
MDPLTTALYLAGLAHFGILIASATAPRALNWNTHLASLPLLLRQMFWVYGVFIVIMIVSFGTLTMLFAPEMARGTPLARAMCIMIAVFWGARLFVQFFIFDAKPWLTTRLYKIGYHGLTAVFIFLTTIYIIAAL